MTEFEYKEIDASGWETLDAISSADKFNKWMYETIRPYCKGKILEVGSGIGNISKHFVTDGADIVLSDIRGSYCDVLRKNFPAQQVLQLDLTNIAFDTDYSSHLEIYDTVFALNVIEHIKEDALAIANCRKLLKQNGNIIILVPAYQQLYNRFDRELEHYRRYNMRTLGHLLRTSNFEIRHSQYFNLAGIMGWFVSGMIQRNKTIPKSQMSLYNKLVPIFRLIDKCVLNAAGLSVISVGRKN